MAVVLSCVAGPDRGFATVLSPGTHTIGRAGTIELRDPTVSRIHATVRLDARGVRLAYPDLPWRRLPIDRKRVRLRFGDTTMTIQRLQPGRFTSAFDAQVMMRVGAPALICLAMIPMALSGPAWRWAMVALPGFMALAGWLSLRQSRRSTRRGRLLPVAPEDVLIHVLLGERGSDERVVPRCLTSDVLWESGEAWSILGPDAQSHAMWLAGWLAATHRRETLGVASPWINTADDDSDIVVTFLPHDAALTPSPGQVVVTYGGPLPWAVPIPMRRRARLPQGTKRWISALAEALTQEEAAASLPTRTALGDILELTTPAVRRRWDATTLGSTLVVPIGSDEDGTAFLDLAAEGPHALVAGTTGSGKSELLTTWLLALAATFSPATLTFLLVDFKGGAAFGPLARLPHTIGVLTDLDMSDTMRALTSLTAQLKRREEIFVRYGVRSLSEYSVLDDDDKPDLPRILVVIDEFQALASDAPDVLDQFVRLATQGRSLGVHLIAATQRPAGAVTPVMRANMPLRLCLRVTTPADSTDVLDSPAAAELPAIPGRLIAAGHATRTLQCAWAGPLTDVEALVSDLSAQWAIHGGGHVSAPWAPPLPARVTLEQCDGAWGRADEPELLRHTSFTPTSRHLMVIGGAESGRTTTARVAAHQLAAAGEHVVFVTSQDISWPGIDTVALHDIHLSRLLIEAAQSEPSRLSIVIDDLHHWRAALDDALGPGTGNDYVERLTRCAARFIAVGDASLATARFAAAFPERLVLAGLDAVNLSVCGVPNRMSPGPGAGRAIHIPSGRAIQLALPENPVPLCAARPPRFRSLPTGTPNAPSGFAGWSLPATAPWAPRITTSVLIIGPAGSGRTTAAQTLAAICRQQGRRAQVIDNASAMDERLMAPADCDDVLIVASDPATVTYAAAGPLAALKTGSSLLLLNPQRMTRVAGMSFPIPGWVYAQCPAMNHPGRGVWIDGYGATIIQLASRISSGDPRLPKRPAC